MVLQRLYGTNISIHIVKPCLLHDQLEPGVDSVVDGDGALLTGQDLRIGLRGAGFRV